MLLPPFFMRMPVAPALNPEIALLSKSRKHHKEWSLTHYSKLINSLLPAYATEYAIAGRDAKILQVTKPSNMTLTEFARPCETKSSTLTSSSMNLF